MPMVNNDEIEYFLWILTRKMTVEQVLKSQDKYKEILKMFLVE